MSDVTPAAERRYDVAGGVAQRVLKRMGMEV